MLGWNTSALKTLSGFWGEICRDVSGDSLSPYNTAFQALASTGQVNFVVGSANSSNDYQGLSLNFAPDSQALKAISSGVPIYAVDSVTGVPFTPAQYCEEWPPSYTGCTLTNGSATVSGSGFQVAENDYSPGAMPVVALGTYAVNYALPLVTVLSIQSNTSLTLTAPYAGSTVSGATLTGSFGQACQWNTSTGDHHQIVVTIDSSTGLPSRLYEMYGSQSKDGGTTWGETVGSPSLGVWDLETGTQNPDSYGASSAAGLPYFPLMANGDEVFAQGVIKHALPVTLGGGAGSPTPWGLGAAGAVFPAPTSNGSTDGGAYLLGGVPLGGRIRLKSTFNISGYSAASQVVLQALKTYGAINVDWTSPETAIQFICAADGRWTTAENNELNAGVAPSNFELIDTIAPRFTISGLSSLVYGSPNGWTITQYAKNVADDSNYLIGLYPSWSADGTVWTSPGVSPGGYCTPSNPGPFTMTMTPPTSGLYLFQCDYGGQPFLLPPNFPFTATTGHSPAAYTSVQAGNWAAPATWGTSTVPGLGDTATVAHAVTITATTTIGGGTASTVLTVAAGSLTVTGAALVIRGNASFGQGNGGVAVTRLAVASSGGAQAGLVLDGNSGVTPVISVGEDTRFTFTGTSGARTFVNTRSTSAGNPGYIADVSSYRSLYLNAAYCDFARLGNSTTPGIAINHLNTAQGGGDLSLSYCTFNGCGTTPALGVNDGAIIATVANCTWQDAVATYCVNLGGSAAVTTGTRTIGNCVFLSFPVITGLGFAITGSYFGAGFTCSDGSPPPVSMTGSFIYHTDTEPAECLIGSASDCYFYSEQTAQSYFMLMNSITGADISACVCEYAGTGTGYLNWFGESEENASPINQTCDFNVVFESSTGTLNSFLATSSNNGPSAKVSTYMRHNTICTSSSSVIVNGATLQAGCIAAVKANVFHNTGTASGNYVFYNHDPGIVVDEAPASSFAANCTDGLGAVAAGTFVTVAPIVSGATTCTNGTAYYSPMSGATSPDATDVKAANPNFYDTTRTLAKWDATQGGPGTAAHAMTLIQATLSLITSSLIPYVQAGYRPTNTALQAASYSGDPSTTDAAGRTWQHGAPDIGAISLT